MKPPSTLPVTQFTDYRDFLRSWIDERKQGGRTFSARQFARRAGISSPNYLQRVLASGLKLTDPMIERFVKGLGLKGREADYFRALVRFNQAEDPQVKLGHLSQLEKLSRDSKLRQIQDRNLLKHWYLPVIWELASCEGFELRAETVVQAMNGAIGTREATAAIRFLEEAGYLVRAGDSLAQAPVRFQSADEVADACVRVLHRRFAELASENTELPMAEREFQGITIAISEERLAHAKRLIKEFSIELLTQLANDPAAERVYRVNLQMFPLTRKIQGEVSHEARSL